LSGAEDMTVSLPLVEIGLIRMVRQADPRYLAGAVFILPLCHLLTSLRWHVLLAALDIRISQARTFTINMVGAFYNAFMPGTTGGDVIKAYYAAKHAPEKRTRAIISVLIDRAIGLYALLIIGGAMAGYQWYKWDIPDCRRVAKIAGILVGATLVGLVVFYVPILRKITGLNFILKKLPMQVQVRKAVDAMETYGRQPARVLSAFLLAFPVHAASILSATFAGKAFDLPLSALYYWAIVPVIALVGAIPISPQGAGVMEFFAVQLTKRQGVTISQAFALTMSIRLVQMLWNVVAGVFVLRGSYRAPTARETEELERGDDRATDSGGPLPSPQS
jgi:glycosyltransferase 2 family protein